MSHLNRTSQIPPEQRNAGAMLHLLSMAGYLLGCGQLIVPAVVWFLYREQSSFVVAQAKEALNFHIGMSIGLFISGWLIWVLIGFVTFAILAVVIIYGGVRAASMASNGEYYRYPLTVRFLR